MRAALLFLAGILLLPTTAAAQSAREQITLETPLSYAELVERLDQAVRDHEMGLVTRASATLGAAQALNLEIPGNMIVGVFRPDYAVRMLDANREAGIEAPLRFYLVEQEDGSARLSYVPPSSVFSGYDDPSGELQALAEELDQAFAAIARDATARD